LPALYIFRFVDGGKILLVGLENANQPAQEDVAVFDLNVLPGFVGHMLAQLHKPLKVIGREI